jgi:hypothetical protein
MDEYENGDEPAELVEVEIPSDVEITSNNATVKAVIDFLNQP